MIYNKIASSFMDPVNVINSAVQKLGYSKLKNLLLLSVDLEIDSLQLKQTTTDVLA